MSLIDTTWYTEPTPPISARPVKVIATWVWGIRGSDDPLTEVTSNLSDYAQKSIDFDLTGSTPPAVVTAYQTSHNDPAVVNELPWGTRIGRLKADFETLAISLTFPDEV